MAEKVFKVGEEIEIVYQAPNKETGLTGATAVEARIYLPNDAEDSDFPLQDLVEIPGSGIYKGVFTPDEQGEWKVVIYKSADGDGQVVKRYSVGAHNVHSVGQEMAKNATVAKETTLLQSEVDIRSDISNLDTKVSSLDTPPMVS